MEALILGAGNVPDHEVGLGCTTYVNGGGGGGVRVHLYHLGSFKRPTCSALLRNKHKLAKRVSLKGPLCIQACSYNCDIR